MSDDNTITINRNNLRTKCLNDLKGQLSIWKYFDLSSIPLHISSIPLTAVILALVYYTGTSEDVITAAWVFFAANVFGSLVFAVCIGIYRNYEKQFSDLFNHSVVTCTPDGSKVKVEMPEDTQESLLFASSLTKHVAEFSTRVAENHASTERSFVRSRSTLSFLSVLAFAAFIMPVLGTSGLIAFGALVISKLIMIILAHVFQLFYVNSTEYLSDFLDKYCFDKYETLTRDAS